MRVSSAFLFLTLVVSVSLTNAAPSSPTPTPGFPSEVESARPSPPAPEKTDTMQWTAPAPDEEKDADAFSLARGKRRGWRSPHNVQVHAGTGSGNILEKNATDRSAFLGVLWAWEISPSQNWDFHLDFGGGSPWLRAGAARRFYFEDTWGLAYWKLGVTQTFEANRFLSAAVDLERAKAVVSLGLADLFEKDRAFTAEIGASWGMIGTGLHAQLGWNFNW